MKNLSKTFRYVNENGDTLTFEYVSGFLINKPTGIDAIQISLTEAQSINRVGSTVQTKTVQSRPIKFSGILVGENQAGRKADLLSVIRPDLSGKLYADNYWVEVYVTSTPTVESKERFAHFQFELKAPYPYWQDEKRISTALYGVQKQFKFPWNISRPYRFGEKMDTQFMNIPNRGQLPVPFTVTFIAMGEVTRPQIQNVKTGERLILDYVMAPGETVVVELTHGRTVMTSSMYGQVPGALDLDSTLFCLYVGDNVLKPFADSNGDQMEVHISFTPEITGVVL